MTKFLDDLKNAADKGEFNSEAAMKINEIADLANKKASLGEDELTESLKKRMEDNPETNPDEVKAVTEEEALELNSKYEQEMTKLKQIDAVNGRLATLIEIEDMVKFSIEDMLGHVEELEIAYKEEFEKENPVYGDLHLKMEEIENKYKF